MRRQTMDDSLALAAPVGVPKRENLAALCSELMVGVKLEDCVLTADGRGSIGAAMKFAIGATEDKVSAVSGAAVADWLIKVGPAESMDDAVQIAHDMVEDGLLSPCLRSGATAFTGSATTRHAFSHHQRATTMTTTATPLSRFFGFLIMHVSDPDTRRQLVASLSRIDKIVFDDVGWDASEFACRLAPIET